MAVLRNILLLLAAAHLAGASEWKTGRATFYGEDHDGTNDGYSIHHGSCQFGDLDPEVGTGWVGGFGQVAAVFP